MKRLLTAAALAVLAQGALAQATPVGLWKTIDDETGKEKSHVRVSEAGGVYTGRVEKILDPAKQDSKCDKCEGARKDAPVLGLTIIENARQDPGDAQVYTGGEILDPNNGKVYRLRLKPLDGGKALEVRGYIGPFYRNQQWIRVE